MKMIAKHILWCQDNEVRTFQLNILTFGISSSPYLTIYMHETMYYVIRSIQSFTERIVKRIIISKVAKIFDPLGILGSIILLAKKKYKIYGNASWIGMISYLLAYTLRS